MPDVQLLEAVATFHSKPMSDDNVMVLKAAATSQSNPKFDKCLPFGTAMYYLSPWQYDVRRYVMMRRG